MIAVYVPALLTPFSFEQAAEAMRQALESESSEKVRDDVLALALAKSALETGRWRSIWNYNWGNVKCGEKYAGMYTCITLNEVLRENGRDVTVWFAPEGRLDRRGGTVIGNRFPIPPGHPQTRMRAHANRFDGAYAYVSAMVKSFPKSFAKLFAGDARAFVRSLKEEHYFTAPEEPYARAVVSLHAEFSSKLKGIPHDETDHDWEDLMRRVDFLRLTYYDRLRESPDGNS